MPAALMEDSSTGKIIAEIGGKHFRLLFRENGFWKADMVELDQFGRWMVCDDDIWVIDPDGKIVGREVGWERRFYKVDDAA